MERRWCFIAFERRLGTSNECSRPLPACRQRPVPGIRTANRWKRLLRLAVVGVASAEEILRRTEDFEQRGARTDQIAKRDEYETNDIIRSSQSRAAPQTSAKFYRSLARSVHLAA
jgi:hypothetical protein